MTLAKQVQNIYQLIADDRLSRLGLFKINGNLLATPLKADALSIFSYRSKRPDEFVKQQIIEELITALKTSPDFKGINHIGFCYKVDSKQAEIKRIIQAASAKGCPVYQEPSSDDAAWIFVGDITEITNPLLEFLPHEGQANDKWIDHYLPHIQFDVDTALSPEQIKTLVEKFIRRPFTPYSIQIDGVTYIQRVNLGCIEGVNIMLDIATNNRDINHRKSWDKLA